MCLEFHNCALWKFHKKVVFYENTSYHSAKAMLIKLFLAILGVANIQVKSEIESDLLELKKSGQINFPFAESLNKECEDLDVRFAEAGSLRMMALVSFPGSGNSWLRYIIHKKSYFHGRPHPIKTI